MLNASTVHLTQSPIFPINFKIQGTSIDCTHNIRTIALLGYNIDFYHGMPYTTLKLDKKWGKECHSNPNSLDTTILDQLFYVSLECSDAVLLVLV